MLTLGEFGEAPAVFNDHKFKYGLYVLFFITTFLTQIIFLNLIIALMSDTFERLMDVKDMIILKQQLFFYSVANVYLNFNRDKGNT